MTVFRPAGAESAPSLSRRDFVDRGGRLALGAAFLGPLGSLACGGGGPTSPRGAGDAHLSSRPPATPPASPLGAGSYRFEADPARDARLYVPASIPAGATAPLVVAFHGAGGEAVSWLSALRSTADAAGLILLVPQSRLPTWDLIYGPFADDASYVDAALAWAFERCLADPARVVALGFSDGATYSLGLGLTNGDLFTHVVAFSPGGLKTGPRRGRPRVFISHGTTDPVLPIDGASRAFVPSLTGAYDVTYREFVGGHVIPSSIATEATTWLKE